MEDSEELIIVEEVKKASTRDKKVFNDVLEEVKKETNNSHYDKTLECPRLLSIILSKVNGIDVLKEMIRYSQEPGYEYRWPREKAYKLASLINEDGKSSGFADRLSISEFASVLNIFEVTEKPPVMTDSNNEKKTGKTLVKKIDKK